MLATAYRPNCVDMPPTWRSRNAHQRETLKFTTAPAIAENIVATGGERPNASTSAIIVAKSATVPIAAAS